MLDRRAWILTVLILLAGAGAYLLWMTRARAGYSARSLSAAPHPQSQAAKPATKTLHVEGCREDFLVSPGEVVEPLAVPGASIDEFRKVYGKESGEQVPGAVTWHTEGFVLQVADSGAGQPGGQLRLSLNSGHIVETLDGVELGLDSFGTILRKMQDRKVEIHERIRHEADPAPGRWILTVTMDSACGRRFRSEYWRSLPDDPETDRLINRRVTGGNGQTGLLRSDIFMNKVVYDLTMEPSNGSNDDPGTGEPSEHD